MTPFETAFSEGERAAFADKRAGRRPRVMPADEPLTPYGEAWWLGYTPRSLSWALRTPPCKAPAEVEVA
jgi:hypothetical protein